MSKQIDKDAESAFATDPINDESEFSDATIRSNFIAKVYVTFLVQILIIFGFIFAVFKPLTKTIDSENFLAWIVMFCMLGIVAMIGVIFFFCTNLRRKLPMTVFLLVLISNVLAFLIELLSAVFETNIFHTCLGIIATICFFITCFVLQTKLNFNGEKTFLLILI
jgi:FtsH-binding integral membrane protein